MQVLRRTAMLGLVSLALSEVLSAQVMFASNSRTPQTSSSRPLLELPARLEVKEVSLTEALVRLSTQSGVTVGFSPSLLRSDARTVECSCLALSVGEALTRLLEGLPVRYEERDGQILLIPVASGTVSRPELPATAPTLLPTTPMVYTTNMRLVADSLVTGRIVDEVTRQPLTDARVVVAGTTRVALTDARGDFRVVLGAPTGTLEVTHIGHQRVTRQVKAGDANLVIAMARMAVQLDQLVITGAAGGASVRSQGNAVSKVDVAAVTQLAPPKDLQTVLSNAVPGMTIQSSSGAIGGGGVYRVRGASSLALNSAPILYIDGIRVNNAQAGGIPATFNTTGPGGDPRFTPSRLNDLNPNDIESIEVVKGPAASTLFGTEASNGVIQITTKRGKVGRPRLEFTTRMGANWLPDPENLFNPVYYKSTTGAITEVNVLKYAREVGFPQTVYGGCVAPFTTIKNGNCTGNVFSTGALASVGANLRGGSDQIRYFFSGEYDDETGSVSYNNQKKLSTRGNLTWMPNSKLTLDLGLGITRSARQSEAPANQPVTAAINFACPAPGCEPGTTIGGRLDGPFRGFPGFSMPERLQNDAEAFDFVNRGIMNLTATYVPTSWWTHRLAVGGDYTGQQLTALSRRVEGVFRNGIALPNGMRHVYDIDVAFQTVDYGTTAKFSLGGIDAATSAGFQYFGRKTNLFWVRSENIAVNALETVGAGQSRMSDEDIIQNKSVGLYVQQQLSWKDRYFTTLALRGDDNSAFGKDFAFVTYPKLSGSWVIGEESWFKVPGVSTAKLRAAWGKAGQQPDAFVAIQTFRPIIGESSSGLIADNLGNANLRPEVGTELETGVDLGLFNEKVGIEFNVYRKRTDDAIVPTAIAPSNGFLGTQLRNLGQVQNNGWELQVNTNLLRREKAVVDLRTTFSRNANKVVSLGTAPRIPLLFQQFHVPGFPLASFFMRRVVSADLNNGVASNVMCEGGTIIPGTVTLSAGGGAPVPCAQAPEVYYGSPLPTWQGSTALTMSLGTSWQFYTAVEYVGGNYQRNSEVSAAFATFGNAKAWLEQTDPILMGLKAIPFDSRGQWSIFNMGYARLREVAATYSFPSKLASAMRASTASATLAWSGNISTFWRKQPTLFGRRVNDPSIRESGNFRAGYPEGLAGNQQDAWPTMQRLQLTLRIVP